ncbi:hypothetical protein JK358_06100 [Nocardia sp. 2]|uniref:CopG family transcriptional regulator n=1 Tax=Nocardia acididurans TaxID=2802282 RepID=A0ABS1M0C6_9NOCA|nr:hypothetical protein [Nocardia acididurans]MBL1073961.1 hypothetical protein [Nocardia acididurans]
MAPKTTKVSLSLDTHAWQTAEAAARKAGISTSAWISKACVDKVVRDFRPEPRDPAADEAEALAEDAEYQASVTDHRRRGAQGAA